MTIHQQPLAASLAILALAVGLPSAAVGEPAYSADSWQQVLSQFVDDKGLVDYQALAQDRQQLDSYIELIKKISPESHPHLFPSRNAKLAYYINAYNAWVFHSVLDLGPKATTVWGRTGIGYGFFVKTKIVVGDKQTNLRKLENKDIREGFEDPRIHAALNCASLGCPRLPQEIFDPENLNGQLDAAMTEFVNDPRHCKVERDASHVTLSKIFDWFRSDFETKDGGLIEYINRFRPADDQIPADFKIVFGEYDKGLNRQ